MSDELEPHEAYANPIRGGWDGYQGTCRDCDWIGAFYENTGVGCGAKDRARAEAVEHASSAPLVVHCDC